MILLWGLGAMMAQEQAKKYEPTEIQSLRLKVALQDAQLSQVNAQRAQDDYNAKVKIFNDTKEQIKKEQGWPSTVDWNFGLNAFIDTKPATPAVPPGTGAPAPTPSPAK
jgi:hypothetical protein